MLACRIQHKLLKASFISCLQKKQPPMPQTQPQAYAPPPPPPPPSAPAPPQQQEAPAPPKAPNSQYAVGVSSTYY